MANEMNSTSAECDDQVDLNNNQNGNDAKSCVNKENESDDLVLKLKRIILEQEKAELKLKSNQEHKPSAKKSIDEVDEVKKSPILIEKSLDNRKREDTSETSKMDNESNDRVDSSPLPSRKEITNKLNGLNSVNKSTNDLNLSNLSNGKANDPNIDHHVIKETIKKLTDKASQLALNRSSSLSSSTSSLTNGSFKIESFKIDSPITKLNGDSKNSKTKHNQNNQSNGSIQIENGLKKANSKELDSIKIIQNKSLNKSTKIDSNNNLDQILLKTKQHLDQQEQKETVSVKEAKEPVTSDNKSEVNDKTEAKPKSSEIEQDKKEEIPEIELIIRVSFLNLF